MNLHIRLKTDPPLLHEGLVKRVDFVSELFLLGQLLFGGCLELFLLLLGGATPGQRRGALRAEGVSAAGVL